MADIIVTLQKEEEGYSVVQESGYMLNFPYLPFYRTLTPAVIPSCAAWFDPLRIHQVEIDSLPEYFNSRYPSKTPSVYMTYRNFIIKLYRDKPTCYLTATHCRRVITGDACSIIRLHAFLEHWGIINLYAEKPYNHPAYDFAWPGHMSYGRKRIYELGRPFCLCCGNICGVTWMSDKESSLCTDCYENGNFEGVINVNMYTQENLLNHFNYREICKSEGWDSEKVADLIKALKRHGEDWEKVAAALNKDKNDVIQKYLSIPLQDLIEAENEKVVDYEHSKLPDDKAEVEIDIHKAMENAKIARKNEEIEIDRILNEMIEIQSKKVEIKSRFILEMKTLLEMQSKNAKLKLEQLVNGHTLLALSKRNRSI